MLVARRWRSERTMFEQTRRPMTYAERAQLTSALRGPRRPFRGFVSAPVAGVIAFLSALVVLPERLLLTSIPIAIGLGVGLATLILARLRSGAPADAHRYRADLEIGEASVMVLQPVEAVAIEESEDEGTHYLLHLSDGRGVVVAGQDLEAFERAKRFPAREVELVYAPLSHVRLGLSASGGFLAPRHRAPLRDSELAGREFLADGEIISAARYAELSAGAE